MSETLFCHPVYSYRFRSLQRDLTPVRRGKRRMAMALQNTGKSNWSSKAVRLKRCFPINLLKLIVCKSHLTNICLEQKKMIHSTQIVKGLLGAGIHGSPLISPCSWPHRLPQVTWLRRNILASALPAHPIPSMDCCHSSIPENSWPFNVVLYRTMPLNTHPQNVCWLFIFKVSLHAKSS